MAVKVIDTFDVFIRAFMPEVGDQAKKIARNLPEPLRKRVVARVLHALAQLIEKSWKGKMGADLAVDIIERFAAAVDDASKGEGDVEGAGEKQKRTEKWFEDLLKSAQEKLKDKEPMEILQLLHSLIDEHQRWQEAKKPTPPPKDWGEVWEKLETGLKKGHQAVSGVVSQIVDRVEEINQNSSRWRLF